MNADTGLSDTTRRVANPAAVGLKLEVSPRRVLATLLTVNAALVLASIGAAIAKHVYGRDWVFGFVPKFRLDAEANVPTWYATVSLAAAALLLWLIRGASLPQQRRRWALLSLALAYVSLDEAAGLHELTILPLRNAFQLTGIFHFSWVLIGIPIAAAAGMVVLSLLRQLNPRTRLLMVLAGCVYVGGAAGMEMVGGFYESAVGRTIVYDLLTDVEEMLEMAGISVLIYALLSHLRDLQNQTMSVNGRD